MAHRITRDMSDMLIDEFVDPLTAPHPRLNQPRRPQNPKVLRNQGLRLTQTIGQFMHRRRPLD
jgi:hypothetical protein